MKISKLLVSFLCIKATVFSYCLEFNTSYDYFRGIPDGSWNGNTGALIGVNGAFSYLDCYKLQLGGSWGLYNWEGRGNLVFKNPKKVEQIGFITVAGTQCCDSWNAGWAYDRIFTNHFSIYDLNPSVDQFRLQYGYLLCSDEIGFWGTIDMSRSHKHALGVPITFKAIGQANLFWTHFFENCAKTSIWLGLPYRKSLRFPHGKAGNFIAGFSFRVPLTCELLLEGYGSYMVARSTHGVDESRNYGANICIGITYLFGDEFCWDDCPYMPLANHSNFMVESSMSQ